MSDEQNEKQKKTAPEPRDDFSTATINELVARAGLRCSVPDCNVLCFGPAVASDTAFNQGTAAHIHSAARTTGPRANPDLTPEQRKSIINGIWCCARHGRLIDSDEKRYSPDLLRRWKREHEERILIEATQGITAKGGVTSIAIENLERFRTRQTILFGSRTLLLGNNGTGRHIVCDFVASLSDFSHAMQWKTSGSRTGAKVEIEAVSGGKVKWQLLFGENLICNVDGNPVPAIYSGFRVFNITQQFFPPEVDFHGPEDGDDEAADEATKAKYQEALKAHRIAKNNALIDSLAKATTLPRDSLLTALKMMALTQGRFLADIRFDGDVLQAKSFGGQFFDFWHLSSSEQQIPVVDLYLRLAEFCARYAPTTLILSQHVFASFDKHNLPRLLKTLAEADFKFQIIVSLFRWPDDLDFDSWTVWQLEGTADGPDSVLAKRLPEQITNS